METFIATKREGVSMPLGQNKVTVSSIASCVGKTHGTKQIEVTLKDAAGNSIKKWFNLQGYQHDADGNLVMDKNGKPKASAENTAIAMNIFTNFAGDCGIEEGTEFSLEDLQGCELGINVSKDGPGDYVVKTFHISKWKESATEADFE